MSDETRREEWGEDGFVAFLRRHGEAYRRPPETPVEAIWEGVREARESRTGETRVTPIGPRRRWALAVAAVLVLGIAIGRISMRQAADREPPAGPAVATRVETPASDAGAGPTAAPDDAGPAPTEPPSTAPETLPGERLAQATPAPAGSEPRDPVRAEAAPEPAPAATGRPADARDLYRLASVQMLAQAEALLVDYRSGRAAGRADAEALGRWARDVLASTRLLLDSRAAEDPEMRGLLQDLELVLAQIVHRTGADPIEGQMIDRSIEEHDLIPRLRTAIPSGGAPIGT